MNVMNLDQVSFDGNVSSPDKGFKGKKETYELDYARVRIFAWSDLIGPDDGQKWEVGTATADAADIKDMEANSSMSRLVKPISFDLDTKVPYSEFLALEVEIKYYFAYVESHKTGTPDPEKQKLAPGKKKQPQIVTLVLQSGKVKPAINKDGTIFQKVFLVALGQGGTPKTASLNSFGWPKSDPHLTIPDAQATFLADRGFALSFARRIELESPVGAWSPSVNLKEFLTGFRDRLTPLLGTGKPGPFKDSKPGASLVDQNVGAFCGAAALLFELIRRKPRAFGERTFYLWSQGEMRGSEKATSFTSQQVPKSALDCGKPPGMEPCDWVWLVGIRSYVLSDPEDLGAAVSPWETKALLSYMFDFENPNIEWAYQGEASKFEAAVKCVKSGGIAIMSIEKWALPSAAGDPSSVLAESAKAVIKKASNPLNDIFVYHAVSLLDGSFAAGPFSLWNWDNGTYTLSYYSWAEIFENVKVGEENMENALNYFIQSSL